MTRPLPVTLKPLGYDPLCLDVRRDAPATTPEPQLAAAALSSAVSALRQRYGVQIQPPAPGSQDPRPSLSAGTVLRGIDDRVAEIRQMLDRMVDAENDDAARWRWLVGGLTGREQQAFVAWLRTGPDAEAARGKIDELRAANGPA